MVDQLSSCKHELSVHPFRIPKFWVTLIYLSTHFLLMFFSDLQFYYVLIILLQLVAIDRVASYGFRVAGCGLRVTGYGLRVAGYGLRVTGCGLRVTSYALRD